MCLWRERRTVSDFPAPPPPDWKTPLTVFRKGHAMRKLLYVNASPRGESSGSRGIADEFLQTYREHALEVAVGLLDLWTIHGSSLSNSTANAVPDPHSSSWQFL